jgi:hypothetical protein
MQKGVSRGYGRLSVLTIGAGFLFAGCGNAPPKGPVPAEDSGATIIATTTASLEPRREPPPGISAVSPAEFVCGTSVTLVIRGERLAGCTAVFTLGEESVTLPAVGGSDSELVFSRDEPIPALGPGTYDVTVVRKGSGQAVLKSRLRVAEAP